MIHPREVNLTPPRRLTITPTKVLFSDFRITPPGGIVTTLNF